MKCILDDLEVMGSNCGRVKLRVLSSSAVIERRLPDLRSMTCGFFPLHFGRWPPDRRAMIGQCPMGRRRMRKSGEELADHPANFNCELNLPGDRRMSAGWVLNRRITAGFLQDSSQGSPHGDPAIDFALL